MSRAHLSLRLPTETARLDDSDPNELLRRSRAVLASVREQNRQRNRRICATVRVRWFIVAPAYHGQGIGRTLLAHAMDFVRVHHESLWLTTLAELHGARHLYESHGFTPHRCHLVACHARTNLGVAASLTAGIGGAWYATRFLRQKFDHTPRSHTPQDIAPKRVMRIYQRKVLHMSDIHLFVKSMTGEVDLLDVDFSGTLEVVRQKLVDQTEIATGQGRSRFAGKFRNDGRSLADYTLQAQATIHWILPLKYPLLSRHSCEYPL